MENANIHVVRSVGWRRNGGKEHRGGLIIPLGRGPSAPYCTRREPLWGVNKLWEEGKDFSGSGSMVFMG